MTPFKRFVGNYGEKLTNTLRAFSDKCWKRAALIIGLALAGYDTVPKPKNLPRDAAKSLGDALDECKIDDYLLVGDKIQPSIINLVLNNAHALTEAFIDRYNEAVGEVRRVLDIARGRGVIYVAEAFYCLGLASIIANAAESGKSIEPGDADAALRIASIAILDVASADLIRPILRALEPLRGKAPQKYIVLLALALNMESLDSGTVRYIFDGLNEVLDNYGDVIKEHAPSLVHAISAYANLLGGYLIYISDEVEGVVRRVTNLLNELGRFKSSLGVIAWAYALDPALEHEDVRRLMEEKLGIDVVDKAGEVLEELGRLRGRVQDLMKDEEFRSYVESRSIKADEKTVKEIILMAASHLKHALAIYRLDNDELDKAEELFNEAAEEYREIGVYEYYLIDRGWALRAEAIKSSLVGDDLVKKFQQLYEKAFSKEHFMSTAMYLSIASGILGEYLVSLALTGDDKKINKLLEEHWQVLNANKQASVLTRLTLNALLSPRVRLSGKLKGRLSVNPEELINAFGSDVDIEFLPALMVALGIAKPKDAGRMCMSINDSIKGMDCMYAVSAAMNDNAAVVASRGRLINRFRGLLSERLGLLKELGADADALFNEFRGLVNGLDGRSLVQLIALASSMARLALMLHALVNGNKELAKAHALIGAVDVGRKLPARLFLEAYRACCDLGSEKFRRAIAKLFFYHV
jgi:tetratricopeptide (TPR) repeat protein